MNQQPLGLRGCIQAVRRHRVIVGAFLLLGLLAGGGYSVTNPPLLKSSALVVLPQSVRSVATQVVIAQSDPVLGRSLAEVGPTLTLQDLQKRVEIKTLTSNILSITAQGTTAEQAERIANSVAASYIAYVGSADGPTGRVQARFLERATSATGTSVVIHVVLLAGMGALAGGLVGAIIAVAISRGDRRLRERDDIADSIGVSVLAAMQVERPSDPGGWTRLLGNYQPTAVEALRLRTALQHLGMTDQGRATGRSVAVLSLSGDRTALAIGPQLASFAAGLGIPTALVLGPQQDPDAAATLRAACAAMEKQARPVRNLWAVVTDLDDVGQLPDVGLTVVVSVVDSQSPNTALTTRTTETVLGVSSGAATAEELARVAASAVSDGRYISGILVADPDPADRTTGRLPELTMPGRPRMPTRVASRSRSVETKS